MNYASDHPLYPRLLDFFSEPDVWEGCAYGLPLYAQRNYAKAWCGYVGVPPHHPHRGLTYGDEIPIDVPPDNVPIGMQSPVSLFSYACSQALTIDVLYDCPGGITWSEPHRPGRSPDGWWYFGFDCSHYNDLSPRDMIDSLIEGNWRSGEYRTLGFVRRQLFHLASQLSDFTSNHPEHFQ